MQKHTEKGLDNVSAWKISLQRPWMKLNVQEVFKLLSMRVINRYDYWPLNAINARPDFAQGARVVAFCVRCYFCTRLDSFPQPHSHTEKRKKESSHSDSHPLGEGGKNWVHIAQWQKSLKFCSVSFSHKQKLFSGVFPTWHNIFSQQEYNLAKNEGEK